MKKSILISAIALAALATLASCQKEQTSTVQFTATIENAEKTYFNISDRTGNPGLITWKERDQVWINDNTFTATPDVDNAQMATLDGVAVPTAPYYAFYPISLSPTISTTTTPTTTTITLPNGQTYYPNNEVRAPMMAKSGNTNLQFKNLCGMLVLTLQAEGRKIRSIDVEASDYLCGTFTAEYNNGEPTLTYLEDGFKIVSLDCGEGVDISTATNFYIYLPPNNYSTLRFSFYDNYGTLCTKTFTPTTAHPTFDVVRNTYNPLTFTLDFPTPLGAIKGRFTVNAAGKQVWFSKGNLQYIGSASPTYWKFADNQWDCLGTTTGQNSSNQNVDRDLFGWGTSGWDNNNQYYRPFDCEYVKNQGTKGYGYGPTNKKHSSYKYPLTDDYADADWAWHNPIRNGGNANHQWRTLTNAEWRYLFNRRTTSGILYAKANVNDVNGVILLPDDWSTDYYTLNSTNDPTANYSTNTITAGDWLFFLEANGAVFLPATGVRFVTEVSNVGNFGYYWSTTNYNTAGAYYLGFSSDKLDPQYTTNRFRGLSVRPVLDYNTAD